jgi:hypothetical protein
LTRVGIADDERDSAGPAEVVIVNDALLMSIFAPMPTREGQHGDGRE